MWEKTKKAISVFENTIIVTGLFATTFVLFADIVLRITLKSGLVWANELARYIIIWIVCSGMGAATREKAHMRITALIDVSKSEKFKKAIEIFVYFASIFMALVLMIYGIKLCGSMIEKNQLSPAMEIPLWTVYLSIPIGAFLMLFWNAVYLFENIRGNTQERHKVS